MGKDEVLFACNKTAATKRRVEIASPFWPYPSRGSGNFFQGPYVPPQILPPILDVNLQGEKWNISMNSSGTSRLLDLLNQLASDRGVPHSNFGSLFPPRLPASLAHTTSVVMGFLWPTSFPWL